MSLSRTSRARTSGRCVAASVLMAVAVLTGCGESAGPEGTTAPSPSDIAPKAPSGLDREGVAAWDLWQEQALDSYTYTLTVGCFCPALLGVEVVVRDGEVVRLDGKPYDPATTVPGFDGQPPTVDHLFEVLAQDQQSADQVAARYDELTGVPISIEVDHMADAIDDEISYRVERLQPL